MLAAAGTRTSQPGWTARQLASPRGAFGWYGHSAPQAAESRGLIAVLDGHVYNRAELGGSGDDAELLLQLYRQAGFEKALASINGDFAAAVYDGDNATLWLGRDRFGVKPLYYIEEPRRFAFASRPRALLALPGVPRDPNPRFVALFAACHYRYFDNDPEASPYAGIAQLPAGHLLEVRPGHVAKRAYWSLTEQPDWDEDETTLAERYRELLLDAVGLRLGSLERPAFTLSGGMDSSSVLASAVRVAGAKQNAFSTVYADKTYDESSEIRSMLDATVERWHPVAVGDPNVPALVRRMVEVHDEPVATATWLSHFLLCEQAARAGFGALLGGMGGDELNAGEYEHFFYFFADLRRAGDEARLEREVAAWHRHHDHPIYRKDIAVAEEALERLVDLSRPGRCRPDRGRIGRYASALAPGLFDLDSFEPVMDHPFTSYLKNRTYQDLARETIPCCLRAEDRQASAWGLDHALPFLDHRLVEFMFRVPGTLKYRDGVTKHLLRRAMKGILPEETRTRVKKTGWNAPAHVWFSGRGADDLLDLVRSRRFRDRGIYVVAEVERLIREHVEIVASHKRTDNHMMFLWQVLNLESWLLAIEQSVPRTQQAHPTAP